MSPRGRSEWLEFNTTLQWLPNLVLALVCERLLPRRILNPGVGSYVVLLRLQAPQPRPVPVLRSGVGHRGLRLLAHHQRPRVHRVAQERPHARGGGCQVSVVHKG
jgi:hypothetical protein